MAGETELLSPIPHSSPWRNPPFSTPHSSSPSPLHLDWADSSQSNSDFCRLKQRRSRESRDLPHNPRFLFLLLSGIFGSPECSVMQLSCLLGLPAAESWILSSVLAIQSVSAGTYHSFTTLVNTIITRAITNSGKSGERQQLSFRRDWVRSVSVLGCLG